MGSNEAQSIINLIKVCIGTGALALPFAAAEGGVAFGVIGLAASMSFLLLVNYHLPSS